MNASVRIDGFITRCESCHTIDISPSLIRIEGGEEARALLKRSRFDAIRQSDCPKVKGTEPSSPPSDQLAYSGAHEEHKISVD